LPKFLRGLEENDGKVRRAEGGPLRRSVTPLCGAAPFPIRWRSVVRDGGFPFFQHLIEPLDLLVFVLRNSTQLFPPVRLAYAGVGYACSGNRGLTWTDSLFFSSEVCADAQVL
jgi:hypothetical protein